MHEGKSPLGQPRAYPVSLASGKPHLVRLSLFGSGLSGLGIRTWDALIKNGEVLFSKSKMLNIKREIEQSYACLDDNIPQYFANRLNSSEHWRMISEFYNSLAYLDIETTGLSSSIDYITTIALYDGKSISYYIHDKNLDAFKQDIQKYKLLIRTMGNVLIYRSCKVILVLKYPTFILILDIC